MRTLIFATAISLLFIQSVSAKDFVRPGANIALNKTCVLNPAGDYSGCRDADDAKQLTDGTVQAGTLEKPMWEQEPGVCWRLVVPVIVTVDLGEVKPIRGLAFHTAAGTGEFTWPTVIRILVTDNEKEFYEVGELITLSEKKGLPAKEGYADHWYWTDELRTHGRYVTLILSGFPFIQTDEIEVYAGEQEWVKQPHEGECIKDVRAYAISQQVRRAIAKRIQSDIDLIGAKVQKAAINEEASKGILVELNAAGKDIGKLPDGYDLSYRAIVPLDPLHQRVFSAQAKLWQAEGLPVLTVWQSGLWDSLSHLADPAKTQTVVRVDMMMNEYRAGSFNLSNATQKPMTVDVRFEGLPGGSAPEYIQVNEVFWTDTSRSGVVASALPEAKRQGEGYQVEVLPGLTRQVWLTFHPTDLKPGTYEGKILVNGEGVKAEIPLTLKVYPIRFPDAPTLAFGGWDYLNQDGGFGNNPFTESNRQAILKHFREHFVSAPWATGEAMPQGTYDDTGRMIKNPDTSNFDTWLTRWPSAKRYYVYTSFREKFDRWGSDEPEAETAFVSWIKFWDQYVRSKGINPENMYLLILDEPANAEQDALILNWAKILRKSGVGFKIWEDPIHTDITKANPEMLALCDAVCSNLTFFLNADQVHRDFFLRQREQGRELEFYSCAGPAMTLDPYAYYRLHAWSCWQYGATVQYFWCLTDTGLGSSWNEFASKRPGYAFSLVFLDGTSITAAKPMEAAREGIEDYEYFVMLKSVLAAAEKNGVPGELIAKAKSLLTDVPVQVIEKAGTNLEWNAKIDRDIADKVRVEVLEMIQTLQSAK
jgi:hypothetical protein